MPDQHGRRTTYPTPVTADHREILGALYAWFDADSDLNWEIDSGAVIPAQIANPGDTGFVIVDRATSTIKVAIADHALVGGVMADGGAPGSGDDLVVGIDPGGGLSDITSAGFSAGTRWSGWTPNAEGPSYISHDGVCKVSSGEDWIFIRFKSTTGGEYQGGLFAGKYNRLDAGIGEGFALLSGLWSDWYYTAANGHAYFESFEANWEAVRCSPGDKNGLQADIASDGVGNFRTAPVCLIAPNGLPVLSVNAWTVIGTLPPLFSSANGTVAKRWDDELYSPVGYNMSGGAWVALDDGTDAE